MTLRGEHRIDVDHEDVKVARQMLKDYVCGAAAAKQTPRGRGQATAMPLADLRKMCAACPEGLAGLRDRALILLSFAVAGRRSELAGLLAVDVAEDDNGLNLRL